MATKMERRLSANSESSIEPMDISSSNKTSSEANSSVALKTSNDSDNVDSDDHEDYHEAQNLMRRDNLRQLMDNMFRKKFLAENMNNLNNNNYMNKDEDDKKYVCPICECISNSQHDFTEHIRSHNSKTPDESQNFTCKICSKVLSSASSLDRHILVHTGERPFTCKYCNLTFTTNGNMHRHMRTHKQADRECYESDGSTDSTGSIGSNNNNNNNNYENENELKRKKMKTTINNNNNIINSTNLQKFCCPVCVRNDFSSMLSLENHMDKEHPTIPAKCRHCEIVFKSHKALNGHRCGNNNYQNITQGFKDLTFVDFTSDKFPMIAKNLCEQSIRTPVTSQKFECLKCYRAFPCASAVDIHSKNCGEYSSLDSSGGGGTRKRKCSDSSEEDARRDDFFANLDLQNKSMSTSDAPTTPSSMDKSFTSPLIKREIKQEQFYSNNFHNDTKDLADIQSIINVASSGGFFRQLDRQFIEKDQFNHNQSHNNNNNNNNKEPEEEAQDAFTAEFRKMKLRGEFPCRLCTAIFPNLRALKGHNRVHLSAAGPGPYRCNMCPYVISDKATLIRHMRSHNGDRPYECMLCNYAFTTKANCERHLRNRHGKSTRDEVKKSIIYHPSEDSSCDDPIKKMAMFSSPDFDKEDEHPKDRSTPVSHLKEMLMPIPLSLLPKIESPAKIQVKSLEKINQQIEKTPEPQNLVTGLDTKPMDLSMDALDLSKKIKTDDYDDKNDDGDIESEVDNDDEDDEDEDINDKMPKIDLSMFEKNQQLLLMQQKLLNEALPKMDPARLFQMSQLFGFPSPAFPIHPFFLQNPLLAPGALNDMKNFFQKDLLPIPQTSGGSVMMNPFTSSPSASPTGKSVTAQSPSQTPQPQSPHNKMPPMMPSPQNTPKPTSQPPITQTTINHHSSPTSVPISNGPVKMVIKNGVLMPKQKQRRYRTERPFACEHCSARFTLRSNMERHIKQQHPQFWAQRQRGSSHLMRRSHGNTSSPSVPPTQVIQPLPNNNNTFGGISEQVKFAILAQQQKAARESPLMIQNLIAQNRNNSNMANNNDDDEPKLIIDEEFQNSGPEDLSKSSVDDSPPHRPHEQLLRQRLMEEESERQKQAAARAVAENILEQAMRQQNHTLKSFMISSNSVKAEIKDEHLTKEEDLASVSRLVDNAKNVVDFGNYFNRPEPPMMEKPGDESDEEGLVASGSASESNNSGTDDPNPTQILQKKKSAYSLAPNRVSCPYCQRMFPWSSSLRRHILTHTGQKPFKCSHCPLLFTTKSNCDRHLLRKHGDVESAMSVPVPIDDLPDPKPEPVPAAIAMALAAKANANASPNGEEGLNLTKPSLPTPPQANKVNEMPYMPTSAPNSTTNSDLPFKCHLCDGSFSDRLACLEHIKISHTQEFQLLMTKVTLEADTEVQTASPDDEEGDAKGKYPDYANRKVICAFCLRRFWSTEDLRRHMRTHSGERPFQCDICFRKFTLKHSMLRHRKKHTSPNGTPSNQGGSGLNNNGNSASDMSDDEAGPPPLSSVMIAHTKLLNRLPELLSRQYNHHKFEENSDLIGNLLGISDQRTLNLAMSSASEAAKILGVDK